MNKKRSVATVLFVILGSLMACSKPYMTPLKVPQEASFKGIETLLKESGAVGFITIHGMCHHGLGWLNESRNRFAAVLEMEGADASFINIYDGGLFGVKAYRADLTRANALIAVYGIIYSYVTLPVKQQELCRDVSHETSVCPDAVLTYKRQRAELNASLKDNLMNDCLADAVAYLGPAGEKIREGVKESLKAIFNDMRKNPDLADGPVMFLSESLGSKVLGDALLCGSSETLQEILPDLARTSHVFLGANQIPLLNLGIREGVCNMEAAFGLLKTTRAKLRAVPKGKGGIAGFLDVIEAARSQKLYRKSLPDEKPESFSIVAFTDPNDLLSYEVSPEDAGGREVINIIVSNGPSWFDRLENPLKAHIGYRENPSVIELLRTGSQ